MIQEAFAQAASDMLKDRTQRAAEDRAAFRIVAHPDTPTDVRFLLHHRVDLAIPASQEPTKRRVPLLPPAESLGDKLLLVFDGGTLTAEQLAAIQLQTDELASYAFRSTADAVTLLIPRLSLRVAAAINAHQTGHTTYLEHGAPPAR